MCLHSDTDLTMIKVFLRMSLLRVLDIKYALMNKSFLHGFLACFWMSRKGFRPAFGGKI